MKNYYIFVVFFSAAQDTTFANLPNYGLFADQLMDMKGSVAFQVSNTVSYWTIFKGSMESMPPDMQVTMEVEGLLLEDVMKLSMGQRVSNTFPQPSHMQLRSYAHCFFMGGKPSTNLWNQESSSHSPVTWPWFWNSIQPTHIIFRVTDPFCTWSSLYPYPWAWPFGAPPLWHQFAPRYQKTRHSIQF